MNNQQRQILVDADACPGVIREIIIRAAQRTQTLAIFVANQSIKLPRSPWLKSVRVAHGFDVADAKIVEMAQEGDFVVTADIPLADLVIDKGAVVTSPRGEQFSSETIKAKLNMRDFMDSLRGSGIHTGGPPSLGVKDRHQFSNVLDRWLQSV